MPTCLAPKQARIDPSHAQHPLPFPATPPAQRAGIQTIIKIPTAIMEIGVQRPHHLPSRRANPSGIVELASAVAVAVADLLVW